MTEKVDSRRARAHAVDIHVGQRVRERRKALCISQSTLAAHVGLTFQQVQKYERGSNRVSASKLYEIGQILQVPAAWFFSGCEGLVEAPSNAANNEVHAFLTTADAIALGEAYLSIRSNTQRHGVLELMRSIAGDH